MPNTITLVAKLQDNLSGPLQHAGNKTTNFKQTLGKLATGAGIAATAIAAVAAAVWRMIDNVTAAAAEIEDLSRATGMAAQELAALGYVFEQDGASLDSFQRGISKMVRSIAYAQEGLTTYTTTFEQLGVSYSDIAGLKPEEQFYILADAIANVENQSLKMSLAQELFGRGAIDMMPTLDRGADALRGLRDGAIEAGIALGDEAYENAKKFQDKITELGAMMQSKLLDVLSEEGVLEGLEELMDALAEAAEDIIPDVVEAIPDIQKTLEDLIPIVLETAHAIGMVIQGWTMLANLGTPSEEDWADEVIENYRRIAATSGDVKTAHEDMLEYLGKTSIILKNEYAPSLDEFATSVEGVVTEQRRLKEETMRTHSTLEETETAMAMVTAAYLDHTIGSQEYSRMIRILEQEQREFNAELAKSEAALDGYIAALANTTKEELEMERALGEAERDYALVTPGMEGVLLYWDMRLGYINDAIDALDELDTRRDGDGDPPDPPDITREEKIVAFKTEAIRRETELRNQLADEIEEWQTAQLEGEEAINQAYTDRMEEIEELRQQGADMAQIKELEHQADIDRAAELHELRTQQLEEEMLQRERIRNKQLNTYNEEQAIIQNIGNSMEGIFTGLAVATTKGEEAVDLWFKNFHLQLIKMAISTAFQALFALLTGGAFGLFGATIFGGASKALKAMGGGKQYGGEIRHAQIGAMVPDEGLYGDRHPYLLERGEVVLPRGSIPSTASQGGGATVHVYMSSTISTASKAELQRAADVIQESLKERGITLA